MVNVDPQTYFTAGSACRQMAGDVSAQLGLLRVSLNQCGGMAGDYPEAHTWGGNYDTKTKDFLNSAQLLVNALENFGDVVNRAGHNWAVANYQANRDPHKGAPPIAPARSHGPLYTGATALPPTSVGANGDGLDTDVPGLLEKIGIPVPNGDTGKLDKASAAWSDFAAHEHISSAGDSLQRLHDSFDAIESDDARSVQEHLQNLKSAAGGVAEYASAMAAPMSSHRSALGDLRTSMSGRSHELLMALGALAATVVVGLVLLTVFLRRVGSRRRRRSRRSRRNSVGGRDDRRSGNRAAGDDHRQSPARRARRARRRGCCRGGSVCRSSRSHGNRRLGAPRDADR